MKLTTSSAMAEIDRRTFEEQGIPETAFMETAGQMIARHIRRHLGPTLPEPIQIYAGKGHNGADALVAARWLAQWGYKSKIWLPEPAENCSELTRIQFDALPEGSVQNLYTGDEFPDTPAGLIVDGLLGTGLSGDPRSPFDQAINRINQAPGPVISIDTPSGLSGDQPHPYSPCVRATFTVSFGLPKLGLVTEPGFERTGSLIVQGLCFPARVIHEETSRAHLISPHEASHWYPHRDPTAHKGSVGRLAILGGSRAFPGAPHMVAEAAGRTGTGLISMYAPEQPQNPQFENIDVIYPQTQAELFEQPETSGFHNQNAYVIGPGLGDSPGPDPLEQILLSLEAPYVLDADGLNQMAGNPEALSETSPAILTPHPGEASRLLDESPEVVAENSVQSARKLQELTGQTVILKTSRPVVAHPDGSYSVHVAGDSSLATAGTGDILAGIIGALLASGLPREKASCLGLLLHGGSAHRASENQPRSTVRANDLPGFIPEVIEQLREPGLPAWYPIESESITDDILGWHPWLE